MISLKLTAINFRLPPGMEPDHDIAWYLAGSYGRKMFWLEAAKVGKDEWSKDTMQGIGPHGKFRPISEEYKQRYRRSAMDRTNKENPPLTPASHQEKSRIISYLRFRIEERGVMYYWIHDYRTKGPWGLIMAYQAAAGREMRGFTQRATVAIKNRMEQWWKKNRVRLGLRGQLTPTLETPTDSLPLPAPVPPPKSKTPVTQQPAIPFRPAATPAAPVREYYQVHNTVGMTPGAGYGGPQSLFQKRVARAKGERVAGRYTKQKAK